MKVIFLDIDGVLNSMYGIKKRRLLDDGFCFSKDMFEENIECLNTILDACPDVKVVISSSWRRLHSLDEIFDMLRASGVHIERNQLIDKTENLDGFRGREIEAWVQKHNPNNYIIIDDEGDMLWWQRKNFVKCAWSRGLTHDLAIQAIRKLRPEYHIYHPKKETYE